MHIIAGIVLFILAIAAVKNVWENSEALVKFITICGAIAAGAYLLFWGCIALIGGVMYLNNSNEQARLEKAQAKAAATERSNFINRPQNLVRLDCLTISEVPGNDALTRTRLDACVASHNAAVAAFNPVSEWSDDPSHLTASGTP